MRAIVSPGSRASSGSLTAGTIESGKIQSNCRQRCWLSAGIAMELCLEAVFCNSGDFVLGAGAVCHKLGLCVEEAL